MADNTYNRHLAGLPTDLKDNVHELSPDAVCQLFQLQFMDDPDPLNRTTIYFQNEKEVIYQGNTYSEFACQLSGTGMESSDEVVRPKLQMVNPNGIFSSQVGSGYTNNAILTELRVLANDLALDTGQHVSRKWRLSKLVALNKFSATFELRQLMDGQKFKVPARTFSEPDFPVSHFRTAANELKGLPFEVGTTDCYGLVRAYFDKAFGIQLPNFARPDNWWTYDLDLFKNAFQTGFEHQDPGFGDLAIGDCFVMAVVGRQANHCAVYVGNNEILHHLHGGLSIIQPFNHQWRRRVLWTGRHTEVYEIVKAEAEIRREEKDILDVIHPRKAREMRAHLEKRGDR